MNYFVGLLVTEMDEAIAALRDMVDLWERVHPGVVLGRPTLARAKKVLRVAEGKEDLQREEEHF